ncbi:MAG: hypothetical protein JKY81_08865 [Colwellia sp.]|nr:hypothetical protein [Colwellia sp.]
MAVTSRQFEQLIEMGINLWQSRAQLKSDTAEQNDFIPQSQQNLENLIKKTLFSDILLSLNLTIGEVKAQSSHLDVGLFNWYFIKEVHNEALNNALITDNTQHSSQSSSPMNTAKIHCVDNKLVTPSINTIAQSATLKRQLWQIITTELL